MSKTIIHLLPAVFLAASCSDAPPMAAGTIDLSKVYSALQSDYSGPGAGSKILLNVADQAGLTLFQGKYSFPASRINFTVQPGPSRRISLLVVDSGESTAFYAGSTTADMHPGRDNEVSLTLHHTATVAPKSAQVRLADSVRLAAAAGEETPTPEFRWSILEGAGYGDVVSEGEEAVYTAPKFMPPLKKATLVAEYVDASGRSNGARSVIDILDRYFEPEVFSVSPSSGMIGTQVTVQGSFFGKREEGSITIESAGGGEPMTPETWSDAKITFMIPNTTKALVDYNVTVTTPGGTSQKSDASKFRVLQSSPAISGIEPPAISKNQKSGIVLKVFGTGFFAFSGGAQIHFGSFTPQTAYIPLNPPYLQAQITTEMLAGPPQAIKVRVVNKDGGETGRVDFDLLPGAALAAGNIVVPAGGIGRDGQYHDITADVTNTGGSSVLLTDATLRITGGGFNIKPPATGQTLNPGQKVTLTWGVMAVRSDTPPGEYNFTIEAVGTDKNTDPAETVASNKAAGKLKILGTSILEPQPFAVPDMYREKAPPQPSVQISVTVNNTGDSDAPVDSFELKFFTESDVEAPGAFDYIVTQQPSSIPAQGSGEFKVSAKVAAAVYGYYKALAVFKYQSPDQGAQKSAEAYSNANFKVHQITVTINPQNITRINPFRNQQFTTVVKDGPNTIPGATVTWSLPDGASTGTIDTTGLYTSPRGLPASLPRIRVRAASNIDPAAQAEVSFSVAVGALLDSYSIEIVNHTTLQQVKKIAVNDWTDLSNPVLIQSQGWNVLTANLVKKQTDTWTGTGTSISDAEPYAGQLKFADAIDGAGVPGPAGYITTALIFTGTISQPLTPVTIRWKNDGAAADYKFEVDLVGGLPAMLDNSPVEGLRGQSVTVNGYNLGSNKSSADGNDIYIGGVKVLESEITDWTTQTGSSTIIFNVPMNAVTAAMRMHVANYAVPLSKKPFTVGKETVVDIASGDGRPDLDGALYVHTAASDKYVYYSAITASGPALYVKDLSGGSPTQVSPVGDGGPIKTIHKDGANDVVYFDLGHRMMQRPPSNIASSSDEYLNSLGQVMGITSTAGGIYFTDGKQVWLGDRSLTTPNKRAYTGAGGIDSLGYGLIFLSTPNLLLLPAVIGGGSNVTSVVPDLTPPRNLSVVTDESPPEASSWILWAYGGKVYFPYDNGVNGDGIYEVPAAGGTPELLFAVPDASRRVSGFVSVASGEPWLFAAYMDGTTGYSSLRRWHLGTPRQQPVDIAYRVKTGGVPYGIFATQGYVYYGCGTSAICRSPAN